MTTRPYSDDVLETVRRAVSDSLAVPLAEVGAESRLVGELGADSLDFVDIVFTLERNFQIKVRETEFSFLTRLDFSSPEVMKDGYLTAPIVEKLAGWLPALAQAPDAAKITPRELFSLISVESICIVVQRRLDLENPK